MNGNQVFDLDDIDITEDGLWVGSVLFTWEELIEHLPETYVGLSGFVPYESRQTLLNISGYLDSLSKAFVEMTKRVA